MGHDAQGRDQATEQTRAAARAARRRIAGVARERADATIARRLSALTELDGPGRLGTYLGTDGEVDPNGGIDQLRARGWHIHLPKIGPDRHMGFAEWSADSQLVANRLGILEPDQPDGAALRSGDDLTAVIVPCVAVDSAGTRLGFGAGYYDRFFADGASLAPGPQSKPSRPWRIAVVYEVQIVDRIDPASWDVPMDLIVSDARVIRCRH